MEKLKISTGVFRMPIWIALIMTLFIAAGCKKCVSSEKKTDPSTTDPSTTALLQGKLYDLVMTKMEYDTLIYISATDTARKLLFHFYFNDAVTSYPTLVAYAAKQKHYDRFRDSVILTPTGTGSFTIPSVKFMGTQQVLVRKIEKLLNDIFPSGPRVWDHLLFTPGINSKGHIIYKITVWCTATTACPIPAGGDVPTNPSPPKDAD